MLVLLTRVNTWTTCIAGAKVKNQRRTKRVGPCATVVSPLSTSASRAVGTDRIKDSDVLLCVTEKDAVVITKPVIDPDLETVCIVCGRTNLRKVVYGVAGKVWGR